MSTLNDALKRAALQALDRKLGYGTTTVGISGRGGGRGTSFTYTVSGMDLPPEVMDIIARAYLTAARRYFTDKVVLMGSPYRTGQTAGQIHPRNMRVFPNRFTFFFPDDKRKGDVTARKKKAQENHWTLPATQIQRQGHQRRGGLGKRPGDAWEAPTYRDVAKGLDATKSNPVILQDKIIIIKAFIEGFRRALRRQG